MPFTPSFSTAQVLGEPSEIVATDTSQGADAAIVARRLYVQIANGDYLVEEGVSTEWNAWALADTSATFDILSKDYGVLLTCQWVGVSGQILYAVQQYAGFTCYNEMFSDQLVEALSGNPLLINDNNFWVNLSKLRDCIDSGNQSIERFSNLYATQQCYDRGTELRLSSQYYFNTNS